MAQPSGSKSSTQASRTTTTSASSTSLEGLQKIGKYEIQKKIGAGGMGAVFLAIDAGLKRSVALKVLPQDKASNPTLVKRFKAEAQAAANLRHDNIVMVYEAGEADGYLYIALEYVEGTDVANLVQKRGVMPVKRTIDVIRQTALALQHAHEQGIVHRDIKPGNLIIRRDGVVKLADMGLARAVDDHMDTSITRAGTTVGTVDYMSPEQARDSKSADVRSDLYSLGCTWYYMLTGVPPFPDGSMTNKLRAHAETPIPDPRDRNPGVTEAVFAVIRRMTEKNPSRRYQTPAELIEDLEAASISRDIVSEAILGEMEDETATIPKRKGKRASSDDDEIILGGDDDRPRKRPNLPALDPSGPGLKPGKEPKEPKASEFVRALPFYVVVVLLVGGVLGGLAWIVKNYSSTIDGPQRDASGNPFASNSGQPGDMGGAVGPDGQQIAGAASGDAGHAPAGTSAQGHAPSTQAITGNATPPNTNQTQVIQGSATATTSIDGQTGTNQSIQGTAIPGSGLPGDTKTVRIGSGAGTESGASGSGSPGNTSISGSGKPGNTAANSSSSRNGTPRNSPSVKERRQKEDSLLPPWSTQPGGATVVEGPRQPKLFVRRNSKEGDRHPDLNSALSQAPAGGATIVLEGPGPFLLSPARIADKTRLVIRTDERTRTSEPPLLILTPSDSAGPFGLEFANTSVELHDIHLAVAGSGLAPPRESAILSLQGGDLTIVNSSMSVIGRSAAPLTAVRLVALPAGDKRPPARVLVDDSTLRGNALTALAIDSPQTEVVIRHSLLWSGAAPALQCGGTAGGSGQRRIQLVSTTVSSTATAVEIAGDAAHPAPTAIEWINSLAATPAPQGAPLARFEGWTAEQAHQELGRALTWKSTDSLYLGWKPLIRLSPGDTAIAQDPGDWQKVWKDRGAVAPQFQPVVWPSQPVEDISQVHVSRLSSETIGKQFVKTSEGGWPGCASELLSTADLGPVELAVSPDERGKVPEGLFDGTTADTIRLDLTKVDLGKALSTRKLQNGTRIVATGHGNRMSSPITIQNVWVRMKFEQTEGQPLVVQPRSVDGGNKDDAFLVVQNGGIEIAGGAFSLPAGEKPAVPRWFAQVTDGDLALSRCRIQGALSGTSRNRGMIQIQGNAAPKSRPFTGPLDGYVALRECFVVGTGTLFETDVRRKGLFVRDSVLVGLEDAIQVQLKSNDSQIGGTIDLETSTISAAGNVLKLQSAPQSGSVEQPLTVYADRCVFAPPLKAGGPKSAPAVLSAAGPALEGKQLRWWENHCGYAADIPFFHREEVASANPGELAQLWRSRWGDANVIAPLTGPQGVLLASDLPSRPEDRSKLEPTSFTLLEASRAATWDGGVRPIGAPLGELKLPAMRATTAPPSTGTKPKQPTKVPPPVKPGF